MTATAHGTTTKAGPGRAQEVALETMRGMISNLTDQALFDMLKKMGHNLYVFTYEIPAPFGDGTRKIDGQCLRGYAEAMISQGTL